ncbi:MAG: Glycine cleavage system protein [Mycobacterium sp.]|nr:Glycine cleavage system protein [Mycobacterium sp.]MDT5063907.1 glycine cleavage system protein [Mycobacterium sp.]MDT5175890.1 glycine cleavage system protein [Mycobacterium sp.]
MSNTAIPDDRSYTEEHEWVSLLPGASLPDEPVRVGVTSIATESLGELVYVELPEVGSEIVAGQSCGEVESTKTVSELYPPVSGRVVEVNDAVQSDPSIITADPYGQGWLFTVQATATGTLLTANEYAEKNEATA